MKSIEHLAAEHDLVKSLVVTLEAVTAHVTRNGDFPVDLLAAILGALDRCVDQVHMAKEEQVVFPYLHAHGLTRSMAVVGALSEQHDAIRVYGRRMRRCCDRLERGDRAAAEEFATTAADFVALFKEHLRIEDAYFYQLADDTVEGPDHAWISARFEEIDRLADAPAARAAAQDVLQRCRTALGQLQFP